MRPPNQMTKARLVSGTTWIALAEALMLPTGFLTVVFLTRQLGPEGYGLFALAATLITWIEWGINSIFSQTTVKFVGEATAWQPVATTVVRTQLMVSTAAGVLLALLAPAIASLLREPTLTYLLWLFALEIPLFNLSMAHQNILTGLGDFAARAVITASRWMARLLLIVGLVELGLSISGAVLGSVAASLISLMVCRYYIRPSAWKGSDFPAQQLVGYAVPLFLAALALRLYTSIDLIALKALGGSAEQAGVYAVAQNLALLGGIMSPAMVPVLLAKLSQLLKQERIEQVKALSQIAMRVVLLHLPFAGVVMGCASELVPLLFGEAYRAAGPLFALLFLAAIAAVMSGVTSAILVASERPLWTLFLAAPMPVVVLVGHWFLIPLFGPLGAALSTLLVAGLSALGSIAAVYVRWQILPAGMTLVRSSVIFAIMLALASAWAMPGLWLLLKLTVLGLLTLAMIWCSGEVSSHDKVLLAQFLAERFKNSPKQDS